MIMSAASTGFLSCAGLIVAIGSQNAYVLRQGVLRRFVAPVVALCIAGDVLLILAGVAGAGVLVDRWPQALVLVRYLGALFMLAYGAMAARRALQGSGSMHAAHARQAGLGRTLLTCLLLSFLNPHVYLDTVVLLGGMASRYPGGLRWVFAAGACAASLVWFICLGFGARLLQPVLARPLAWRLLDGAVAVSMLAMALLLLLQVE